MVGRYCFWAALGGLSGLLLAGCSGSPARKDAPKPGDSSRSVAANDRSMEDVAAAHAHYAAGVVREIDEDQEGALQEYQKAAMADPEDEWLVLEVSQRLMQNKELDKALEVLVRAGERPKVSGQVLTRLGQVYSQLGKTDLAVAAERAAIKKSPTAFGGYETLFLCYLQHKQPQEAEKVLDDGGRQPESGAEFLVGLAELYANLGLQTPARKTAVQAKALAVLRRAEKLQPASPPLRLRLADAFDAAGDSAEAAQLYLELLKQLPDAPPIRDRIHAKLTDIYLRGREPRRAIEQLEAIVHDDPTNPQAYYYLGSILFDEKKLAEAADCFGKAILLKPDLEEAYYDLAQVQLSMDKDSESLATLERARQKFAPNFVLEYFTGMAFSRQKAYAEALEHFTAAEVIAQATNPKLLNENFYFQLGAANERKSDYAQAEKYFEKCLQLEPNFAEAMNYLGYMWAEHGQNLDRAHELIQKAVKAEPKNAAYLDSLAWVLFKLKQPQDALPYALQAVAFSETPDATVYDHVGDIYAALNQLDNARAAWRKSLSLEASEEVRKKLGTEGK